MISRRVDRRAMLGAVGVVLVAGCGAAGSKESSDADHAASVDAAGSATSSVTSAPDASTTPPCDPNNPLGVATIGPVSDANKFSDPSQVKSVPTACPGYDCTYEDFEITYNTCAGPIPGARFRYVRPLDKNVVDASHVPVFLEVPGTGDCNVGTPSPDPLDMLTAQSGGAALEVAPRGHGSCYFPGDAFYQQADWMGPATISDYDRLLLSYQRGQVDTTLKGDPARSGVHGGSYGGISSYVIGRASHVPSITKLPFQLVIPIDGNPDTADWTEPGIDPADAPALLSGTASSSTPWGAFRLSGETSEQTVYPGPYNTPLRADVLADRNLPSWIATGNVRSAHDDLLATDTSTFRKQVKYSLAKLGSQDCIIPHAGAFEFYDQLSKAGVSDARFISPISYHACQSPDSGGYFPKISDINSKANGAWLWNIEGGWTFRYLFGVTPPAPFIDPGVGEPTAQPDWMFMLGDEAQSNTLMSVYTAAHPGALVVTPRTLSLTGTPSIDQKTLAYNPDGQGTTLDLEHPTWNEAARAEIDLDFPVPEDTVVIGQPDLVVFVSEATGQPFTFTAILEDIVPATAGAPAQVWPVGSERRYSHTSTETVSRQEVLLDEMVHRFRAGDTMRIAISNLSLIVPAGTIHTTTMHGSSLNSYALTFHAGMSSTTETSHITLPTIPGSALVKAPAEWQVPQ